MSVSQVHMFTAQSHHFPRANGTYSTIVQVRYQALSSSLIFAPDYFVTLIFLGRSDLRFFRRCTIAHPKHRYAFHVFIFFSAWQFVSQALLILAMKRWACRLHCMHPSFTVLLLHMNAFPKLISCIPSPTAIFWCSPPTIISSLPPAPYSLPLPLLLCHHPHLCLLLISSSLLTSSSTYADGRDSASLP
jgi:hypothetical protein